MQIESPAGEDDNNFAEGMTTDLIFWLCGENTFSAREYQNY